MPTVIKVATWNVNSLRVRLPQVQQFLSEEKPAILCLQETKMENPLFPHEIFAQMGYQTAHHGQKSYNGVAILSTRPLTQTTTGFNGTDHAEQTRVLATTTHGLRIINAYVTNGEATTSPKFALKEEFYRHLTEDTAHQAITHPNLVVVGDFNVAADERDVPNPERAAKSVLFTPQERDWLATFRARTGLQDSLRLLHQEPGIYSWWDYRTYARSPQNGMRIDYVFVSPALAPKVTAVTHHSAYRTQTQPSDHIPVTAALTL